MHQEVGLAASVALQSVPIPIQMRRKVAVRVKHGPDSPPGQTLAAVISCQAWQVHH